jgi:DNA-directed RNA polymerase subunit omega
MLDPLKDESIVEKVGGRFKLSTLIQKRLVQLNGGSRPLVEPGVQDKVTVVLKEVGQDKIFLDTSNEGKSDNYQGAGDSIDLDLGDL